MNGRHTSESGRRGSRLIALAMFSALLFSLSGCGSGGSDIPAEEVVSSSLSAAQVVNDVEFEGSGVVVENGEQENDSADGNGEAAAQTEPALPGATQLAGKLDIVEDCRTEFSHGVKTGEYQRYIMLHDTESDTSPRSIVDYWDSVDNGVAAHFVVGKDGSIVQCVPLDQIAHHAGYGDAGHNDLYGLVEDGRDDMVGTVPIGDWAPDYGMNAWSVGIEMVHVGGEGGYPEAQLAAVDALIEYIDAYYGTQSEIVDHKAWRTGNSDTSSEFAAYLANYQAHRTHDGK